MMLLDCTDISGMGELGEQGVARIRLAGMGTGRTRLVGIARGMGKLKRSGRSDMGEQIRRLNMLARTPHAADT